MPNISRRTALRRGGQAVAGAAIVAAGAGKALAAGPTEPSGQTTKEATVQFFDAGLAVRSRLSQQGLWTEAAESWFGVMAVAADVGRGDNPRYFDYWPDCAKEVKREYSGTVAVLGAEIESGRAS